MPRNRRQRTKATTGNNSNHGDGQMLLALPGLVPSGEREAPVPILVSPDLGTGSHADPEHLKPTRLSPGAAPPQRDSQPRTDTDDQPSASVGAGGNPSLCASACFVSVPSTWDQHKTGDPPARRLTLASVLEVADLVLRLKTQAADVGRDHAYPGTGDPQKKLAGKTRGRHFGTLPDPRSDADRPDSRSHGDPTIPQPQGDRDA